ncbi:MAG: ROK family protein, partial [Myxococcota bacterium]|nr:ROK family protein [Myxococcota bacterium]
MITFCADIGGSRLKSALVDETGEIRDLRVDRWTRGLDPGPLFHELAGRLQMHRKRTGEDPRSLGLSIAAIVENGRTVRFSTNLDGANSKAGPTDLDELSREHLGLPARAGNDGHCMALGEHRYGAGTGTDHLVTLCLGTGVGGGVIAGGRLLRGARGAAVEVGHIQVDSSDEARACGCGARGCLETYTS